MSDATLADGVNPPASADDINPTYNRSANGRLLVAWILRMLVAGLFIYAAVIKIDGPSKFATDIRKYELFPEALTNVMAYTIPWLEFITASLLITGLWRLEARILILGMLVSFTVLKIVALNSGAALDCGCFGDTLLAELSKGWNGVWLNIGMLVALLIEALLSKSRQARPAAS